MIQDYLKQLEANGRSLKTISTYAYVLNRLNNFKTIENITKNNLIEFFTKFEGTVQSKRLFQGIIKKFFKDTGKSEIADWIQLVNIKIIQSDKNTLVVEDINNMINATTSLYWKAYIAVLFETGSRFNELRSVKWSDFIDNILEISTSKTGAGMRRIPLVMSGNYLRNLQINVKALSEDLIFSYSEPHVVLTLRTFAKAAGIKKPCNPHRFRHARATDLVRRGVQESIIRKILGWTPSSTMIARYQHLADDSIINAMTGEVNNVKTPDLILVKNVSGDVEILKNENQELKNKMAAMELMINSIANKLGEEPRKLGMKKIWQKKEV